MTVPGEVDPSFQFGQIDGLWAYKMARSIDPASDRHDELVLTLVDDAIRTAIGFRNSDPEGSPAGEINVEKAKAGLFDALKSEFDDLPSGDRL